MRRGTILQLLQRFADEVKRLDAERVLGCSKLSATDRARALAAFRKLGHERLGPVHGALVGSVPYEELHLLRLYLPCRT